MASIGPELPPHLTKRKRMPSDEDVSSQPVKKQQKDSDLLGSDSDVDNSVAPAIGLSAPASIGQSMGPSAGPSPEPSSSVTVGPSPPPASSLSPSPPRRTLGFACPPSANPKPEVNPRSSGPAPVSAPVPAPTSLSRILGPTLPTADNEPGAESDDSNDEYCPSLPTSSAYAPARPVEVGQFEHHEPPTLPSLHSILYPPGPPPPRQRDEWMLAPPNFSSLPSSSFSRREPDPTRLRARKFASGPRASTTSTGGVSREISSLWTETATEKAKRVADSVLGRTPDPQPSSSSGLHHGAASATGAKNAKTEEEENTIRANISAARGPSLMEMHREMKKREIAEEEEKDDPSKRAFDREKDMTIGGRGLGGRDRNEVLRQAKDFGSRFGKGTFL